MVGAEAWPMGMSALQRTNHQGDRIRNDLQIRNYHEARTQTSKSGTKAWESETKTHKSGTTLHQNLLRKIQQLHRTNQQLPQIRNETKREKETNPHLPGLGCGGYGNGVGFGVGHN